MVTRKKTLIKRPNKRQYDDDEDEELEDDDLEDDEDDDTEDDENDDTEYDEDDDTEDTKESRILITKWKKVQLQNKKLKKELATLQKNGETAKLKAMIREILNEEEEEDQNLPKKKKLNVRKNVRQKRTEKPTNSRLFRKRT